MAVRQLQFKFGFDIPTGPLKQTNEEVDKLKNKVHKTGEEVDKLGQKFGGGQFVAGLEKMKMGLGAGFAAGALGISKAVNNMADYEMEMLRVKGLSQATQTEYIQMDKLAKKLGQDLLATNKQAAEAMGFLAMKGYKVNDILSATPGLMLLAEALRTDVGETADITAGILRGFSLQASETGRVADILCKALTETGTTLQSTGDTMKYAASMGSLLGFSIEEVTAAMGLMARRNVSGEMAGTALRQGFLRLVNPPKDAAAAIKTLGLHVTDVHGKMLPLSNILRQIYNGTKDMETVKKATIIGDLFGMDAVSGIAALLEEGPDKFDELTKKLQNSAGAAAKLRDELRKGLKYSMDNLGSSVNTLSIVFGERLKPVLQPIIDSFTAFINALVNLPEPIQTALAWITTITVGAMGLGAAMGFGKAGLTQLAKAFPAIAGAGTGALAALKGLASFMFGPWGLVIAAVALLAWAIWDLWNGFKGGKSFLMPIINGFLDFIGAGFDAQDMIQAVVDALKWLWKAIQYLWGVVQPIFKALFQIFKGYFLQMKGSLMMVLGLIHGLLTGDFTMFLDGLKTWGEGVKGVFKGIWDYYTGFFRGLGKMMGDFWNWIATGSGSQYASNSVWDVLPPGTSSSQTTNSSRTNNNNNVIINVNGSGNPQSVAANVRGELDRYMQEMTQKRAASVVPMGVRY